MNIQELGKFLQSKIPDAKAGEFFLPCFLSTWETTVKLLDDDQIFLITGDIPAMWLRDSSAQVHHYLKFANASTEIQHLIEGLIAKQIDFILKDPYANAFNAEDNGAGHQDDRTEMGPGIWERKYEIDSLCYPVDLAYKYYEKTGNDLIFTDKFHQALHVIVDLWKAEQNHADSDYYFERNTDIETDTLPNEGRGSEVAYTGMTWSGFRPSDDACTYGYLVPSNMFAVVVLMQIQTLAEKIFKDKALADKALALEKEIRKGIDQYALYEHEAYGTIYAYEVDGLGNQLFMDDANVPSLLSIPYLGFASVDDPIYQNTRNFILSPENPYFFQGEHAQGIGSPHTPENYVWHIALTMQALTSDSKEEQKRILDMIFATDADTRQMHEGFNVDNPSEFTRPWFAWANSLLSVLMIRYYDLEAYTPSPKEERKN